MQAQQLKVKLSEIRHDDTVYPRPHIQEPRLTELREIYRTKGRLDPVILCRLEKNGKYVDVDGRHRIEMYRREGEKEVQAVYLGLLTKREAIMEAWDRNSHGPLGFTRSDREVAAKKMLDLGIGMDQVHSLTSLAEATLKQLSTITYEPSPGHVERIPRALTYKTGGVEHLAIERDDLKAHLDDAQAISKNFYPKAAMRHLISLLDLDWLQYRRDPEVMRLAVKLYERLKPVMEYQEKGT